MAKFPIQSVDNSPLMHVREPETDSGTETRGFSFGRGFFVISEWKESQSHHCPKTLYCKQGSIHFIWKKRSFITNIHNVMWLFFGFWILIGSEGWDEGRGFFLFLISFSSGSFFFYLDFCAWFAVRWWKMGENARKSITNLLIAFFLCVCEKMSSISPFFATLLPSCEFCCLTCCVVCYWKLLSWEKMLNYCILRHNALMSQTSRSIWTTKVFIVYLLFWDIRVILSAWTQEMRYQTWQVRIHFPSFWALVSPINFFLFWLLSWRSLMIVKRSCFVARYIASYSGSGSTQQMQPAAAASKQSIVGYFFFFFHPLLLRWSIGCERKEREKHTYSTHMHLLEENTWQMEEEAR